MHELPKYHDLMLPVLRAVETLGGSGAAREISATVVEAEGFSDDMLAITYDGREKSILLDRLDWARSYCKLSGVLDSPKRGLFLLSDSGRAVLSMAPDQAWARLLELDKAVRQSRSQSESEDAPDSAGVEEDTAWEEVLLRRLHGMSPPAFELFVLFLLRSYGMELRHVGGTGDEGIDGIGTAPLTSVLSTTVAVQAKRYEPSKTVGRETVALFQSDAVAAGAERGILVTTARFSEPARKAALGRNPTIDLIDGAKLAELCVEAEAGVQMCPVVKHHWFDRFEK